MATKRWSLVGTTGAILFLASSVVAETHATELVPTGAERVVSGFGEMLTLTRDGQGDVWVVGDGLMHFGERDGSLVPIGQWSLSDDVAFAASTVAPARDGGVWLGGPTIRHFDGMGFTQVIDPPHGMLFDLLEAPDGSLWAMVDDGTQSYDAVWRWDGSDWTDMEAGHALGDLGADDQGRVWVLMGTYPGPDIEGVAVFADGVWHGYGSADHPRLGSGSYGSLEVAPTGEVYVRTAGTVLTFDGYAWTEVEGAAISGGPTISVGPDGTLWVATSRGLQTQRPGEALETVEGPAGGWPGIRALQALEEGAVVATEHGIHEVRGGSVTTVWAPPRGPRLEPYPSGSVIAGETDVWVSGAQGVWRCPIPAVASGCQLMDDGLSDTHMEEPVALARAPDGTLWSTGAGGTAYLDGTGWERIDDVPGQALAIGPDGTVWVLDGTGEGLVAWSEEDAGWSSARQPGPDRPLFAPTMDVLPDGTIVAHGGGYFPTLASFDGSTWTTELEGDIAGRPLEWVLDAAVDADGRRWVLWSEPTRDGDELPTYSTARLDDGAWEIFDLPDIWPYGMVAGAEGSAWLGSDNGLLRFSGDGWTTVAFEDAFVVPLAVAMDGSVLFLDYGGGLYRLPAS